MKNSILILTLFAALSLAACEVNVPATSPGPAGPQGAQGNQGTQGTQGTQGETGKSGDGTTVIVTPPAPAPAN